MAVCLLLSGTPAAAKPESRLEKGALYLADFTAHPHHLRVVSDAPVYAEVDGGKLSAAKLPVGQAVELVAVSESSGLLCVREDGKPEATAAWVPPRCLTPLDPPLTAAIKMRLARRRQVRALAARGEIAVNMTRQEVTAILDKPFKRIPGANDGVETWEYPFYIGIPRLVSRDDYSRSAPSVGLRTTLLQDRIQDGTILVMFTNNLVSDIAYRDVPGFRPGHTPTPKTVPPPMVLR